jgi:hypothetical protein
MLCLVQREPFPCRLKVCQSVPGGDALSVSTAHFSGGLGGRLKSVHQGLRPFRSPLLVFDGKL